MSGSTTGAFYDSGATSRSCASAVVPGLCRSETDPHPTQMFPESMLRSLPRAMVRALTHRLPLVGRRASLVAPQTYANLQGVVFQGDVSRRDQNAARSVCVPLEPAVDAEVRTSHAAAVWAFAPRPRRPASLVSSARLRVMPVPSRVVRASTVATRARLVALS